MEEESRRGDDQRSAIRSPSIRVGRQAGPVRLMAAHRRAAAYRLDSGPTTSLMPAVPAPDAFSIAAIGRRSSSSPLYWVRTTAHRSRNSSSEPAGPRSIPYPTAAGIASCEAAVERSLAGPGRAGPASAAGEAGTEPAGSMLRSAAASPCDRRSVSAARRWTCCDSSSTFVRNASSAAEASTGLTGAGAGRALAASAFGAAGGPFSNAASRWPPVSVCAERITVPAAATATTHHGAMCRTMRQSRSRQWARRSARSIAPGSADNVVGVNDGCESSMRNHTAWPAKFQVQPRSDRGGRAGVEPAAPLPRIPPLR